MSSTSRVHSRELLEALERIEPLSVEQRVWRIAWKGKNVIQGGLGGRWSPKNGPEVLYTSEAADGAFAEIYYHLALAPVFTSCEMLCYPIDVRTDRTLCLDTEERLESVGLSKEHLVSRDLSACQSIGAAAHLLEFDSMWVPSARWPCRNLVILLDQIPNWEDQLEIGAPNAIN